MVFKREEFGMNASNEQKQMDDIAEKFMKTVDDLKEMEKPVLPYRIGRNEKCPLCKSGMKFKHCACFNKYRRA